MKRIISILLSVMMIVGLLSACAVQATPTQAPSATAVPTAQPKVNEFGWVVPEKTLEFTVYKGQFDQATMDGYAKREGEWLLKNFNIKITNIWSDATQVERLNLYLAAGDYPEVIGGVSNSIASDWAKQNKAILLNPYLDAIGGTYKSVIGTALKRTSDDSGNNYWIPSMTGSLDVPIATTGIRWDWYQEIGAPKFQSAQEFYDVLKQILVNHPKNANGEKTYALASYDRCNVMVGYLNSAYGLNCGWKIDESNNLTHWINTTEGYEVIKFINQLYRDKTIDPDSYIQTYAQWTTKMVNDRAFAYMGSWSDAEQPFAVWIKEEGHQDTKRIVQFKVVQPGTKGQLTPQSTNGFGAGVFLTDKAVTNGNIEEILKWYEFQLTETGMKIVGWGIPNEADSLWDFKDGKGAQRASVLEQFAKGTFDYMAAVGLGWNRFWDVAPLGPMSDGMHTFIGSDTKDQGWMKVMYDNMNGTVYDATDLMTISVPLDSSTGVTQQAIKDILDKGLIKAFEAKTDEELLAAVAKIRSECATAGIADYEKFYTEQYKKNIAKSAG
jgi:putative aldouronate transport system substrate-binding protein